MKITKIQTKMPHQLTRKRTAGYARVSSGKDAMTGFDEELWNCTVESVTVLVCGGFQVRFKDRLEVEVPGK